jgi:hypothetical protein
MALASRYASRVEVAARNASETLELLAPRGAARTLSPQQRLFMAEDARDELEDAHDDLRILAALDIVPPTNLEPLARQVAALLALVRRQATPAAVLTILTLVVRRLERLYLARTRHAVTRALRSARSAAEAAPPRHLTDVRRAALAHRAPPTAPGRVTRTERPYTTTAPAGLA